MVAVVVSRLNGCAYCLRHHHAGLLRLLPETRSDVADGLREDRSAGLSEREAALVEFATALTRTPDAMDEGRVARLREAGLDDRAILDLTQCVGYFNYVNRIVTGLGVSLGEGEGPTGQWPAEES